MRVLSTLAFACLIGIVSAPVFAQSATSITIDHPWAPATPNGAKTAAIYMTVSNSAGTSDRLTGGSTPAAKTVQIHEMKVVNGIMHMRQLPLGLEVPASGSVTLKPGAYHVMLIGLKKPLKPGETIPVTLTFEKAGSVAVKVPVEAKHAM